MKKNLLGFVALILAVSLSAYTAPKSHSDEVYDYVGVKTLGDDFTGTPDDAFIHYSGCRFGSDLCAKAYEEGTQIRVSTEDLEWTP